MGQWYNYDLKSQKALITLMERSKTPMLITAGKILPLSLETFTMVIIVERLSYSSFYEKNISGIEKNIFVSSSFEKLSVKFDKYVVKYYYTTTPDTKML
jgi:hypothetical protein